MMRMGFSLRREGPHEDTHLHFKQEQTQTINQEK